MYKATTYNGKWAILDTRTNVWYFIGCGKKYCIAKANELNSGA